MGIQRATVLYPVNTTTVDTGTGIDIRLLDSAEAGADDSSQTVQATHTQDNQGRVFDPGTSGVTTTTDVTTLTNKGWALRLTEDMTPGDDTNCNAYLPAGTLTFNMRISVNQSGGTYVAGSYTMTPTAAIFRYDPVANTGTLIASGSGSLGWTIGVGSDLGTFKNTSLTINVASGVEFLQGEILLLQIGINTATIPNPTLGTGTWTYTLAVDNANTNITWASGQGIRQLCGLSHTIDGRGVSTRLLAGEMARSATGKGDAGTSTKAATISKIFDLIGSGVPSGIKAVLAAKTFDLVGTGTNTKSADVSISRTPVGSGDVTATKAVLAAKTFDLVGSGTAVRVLNAILIPRSVSGSGTVTEVHPVQAYRTFNLQGKGQAGGRIEIPIDEVPEATGGATVVHRPIYVLDD